MVLCQIKFKEVLKNIWKEACTEKQILPIRIINLYEIWKENFQADHHLRASSEMKDKERLQIISVCKHSCLEYYTTIIPILARIFVTLRYRVVIIPVNIYFTY